MVENLEQAQKNKQLDEEYNSNEGKGFKEAKEDKLGFYGDFKNQKENEQVENNEILQNIPKKVKLIPEFPIIENLFKNGSITDTQLINLSEQLEASNKDDINKTIKKFLDTAVTDEKQKDILKKYFNQEKKIDEHNFEESDFNKEIKLSGIEINKGIGELEIMLANNFVNLGGEKQNSIDNIYTTINITTNKLIERKSSEFIENNAVLIGEIKKADNPQIKYNKLKELYSNYLIDDAKFGGTKAKKEIAQKNKSLESKTKNIKQKLQEKVKENKISQEQANEKWTQIQQQLQKEWKDNKNLEKEIKEIEGMIKSGKFDGIQENTESNKQ